MRLRERVIGAAAVLGAATAAWAIPTPEYLAKAGQSDLFERETSRVVLDSSKDPAIRRFAAAMIAEHAQSTQMVLQAAEQAGFHPAPPELAPAQLRMLADLKDAQGAQRDQLYVEQQKQAHDGAMKLQEEYALTGGIAPIKAAAARITEVVQQHRAMLNKLRPM